MHATEERCCLCLNGITFYCFCNSGDESCVLQNLSPGPRQMVSYRKQYPAILTTSCMKHIPNSPGWDLVVIELVHRLRLTSGTISP